jgi:tRNA threonylcarbamoyladenosine biosynthesis protein TsaE
MTQDPLQISYSLATIRNAAHQLWQYGHQYRVWTLNGQLGAGKTTIIHNICDILGVQDAVSSPTFALINEYHFQEQEKDRTIYHLDWYRLRDTAEAINAGMEDAILSGNYCFVEWAEKAKELLPSKYLQVDIEWIAETERKLTASIKS